MSLKSMLMRFALVACVLVVASMAHAGNPQQSCGGNISYGKAVKHFNKPKWPHCDYWFRGKDDDLIEIKVKVLSGNLKPSITFFDASARHIAKAAAERLKSRLNRGNGRYGFRITSALNPRTYGTFEVSLRFRGNQPQTCGGNIRYNQTVSQYNEKGWPHCDYWFRGTNKDVVEIKAQRLSGNLKPSIILFDSSARIISKSKTGTLRFRLNRGSGRYGFRLTSAVNPRTYGKFKVSLKETSPSSPPTPQPKPAALSGALVAKNVGTSPQRVELRVQGTLLSASGSGSGGRSSFSENFFGTLPAGGGGLFGGAREGNIGFAVKDLRAGRWSVTTASNITGAITCPDVRVPGRYLVINANATSPSQACR